MLNLIGENAGKVWNYLNENNEVTLASLKKDLNLKGDSATLAVGWLARENAIDIAKKGASVKIKLKD